MIEVFLKDKNIIEQELIEELKLNTTVTEHRKGTYIIKNNEFIKVLKIVLKGTVRVYQERENKEILIYYLNEMETCTLSLSACYSDCQSTVNAIAEADCVILNIPVRFVRDWSFKYRSWHAFTIQTFRESYHLLLDNYSKLAFNPIKERLTEYLKYESKNNLLERSHQQIANELGTTREVVSRLLKKMEEDGKVILGQKIIKIN